MMAVIVLVTEDSDSHTLLQEQHCLSFRDNTGDFEGGGCSPNPTKERSPHTSSQAKELKELPHAIATTAQKKD